MPARARRLRRPLAALLVVAGLLLLADVAVTVAWQEPLSALREARAQDRLDADLRALEAAPAAAGPIAAAATGERRRVALLARALDGRAAPGAAIGRLRIPRLGLDAVVVHGSDLGDLRRGPGTITGSPLPGAAGTAAIAGHRTTYGAPFAGLDQLARGDVVVVEMPYATLRYRVEDRRIVAPDDVSVLRRRGHDRLVLVACHPRFSAAQRIVVAARLQAVEPRAGAARRAVPAAAFGRSATRLQTAFGRVDPRAGGGRRT